MVEFFKYATSDLFVFIGCLIILGIVSEFLQFIFKTACIYWLAKSSGEHAEAMKQIRRKQ